jgi:hypothetical protein
MAKRRTRGSGDEPNTERGTMYLSCKLTESEVVSERAMTYEERQEQLFPIAGAKREEGAGAPA